MDPSLEKGDFQTGTPNIRGISDTFSYSMLAGGWRASRGPDTGTDLWAAADEPAPTLTFGGKHREQVLRLLFLFDAALRRLYTELTNQLHKCRK